MIRFVLRVASTWEKPDVEQQALRKFSAKLNLSFIKRKRYAPSTLADTVQITDPSSLHAKIYHMEGFLGCSFLESVNNVAFSLTSLSSYFLDTMIGNLVLRWLNEERYYETEPLFERF